MVAKVDTAWMGSSRQRSVGIREKLKRATVFSTNPRTVSGKPKERGYKPKPITLAKVTIALMLLCGIHGPRALPKPAPNPQIEQDVWMQKWCETSKSGGYLCKEDR